MKDAIFAGRWSERKRKGEWEALKWLGRKTN